MTSKYGPRTDRVNMNYQMKSFDLLSIHNNKHFMEILIAFHTLIF